MSVRLLVILACALGSACRTDQKGDDTGGVEVEVEQEADLDGDGFVESEDCDDEDPSVNPLAQEECDGVDNDCDEQIDEEVTTTWYADTDGDGFGDEGDTT
ncbi:MAG: putative metal-binding motif-containing protein, partial [Myxococcota bacterium]|nr:putative metal-binding motif-containing protein [Myxococcota bacterium]